MNSLVATYVIIVSKYMIIYKLSKTCEYTCSTLGALSLDRTLEPSNPRGPGICLLVKTT